MLRFALAFMVFSLLSSPAGAARLAHPSAVVKTSEKGVAVWRGKAAEPLAPPSLKPAARCAKISVIVTIAGDPPRRLRTHGFWSGENYAAAYQATTQGFYADRMAAGD
ncbi:MAG: hypothetical protein AAB227_00945 [Pseudomonadota bacterium]